MSSGFHQRTNNLVKQHVASFEIKDLPQIVKNPQFGPEDPRRYYNDGDTIIFNTATNAFVAGPAGGGGAQTLDQLNDVTAPAPSPDNAVLKFNAGTGQWEAEAVAYSELTGVPTTFPPAPHNLDSHTDVTAPAPADNTVLKYNAGTTQWEAEAVAYSELTGVPTQFPPAPHNLDSHTDVTAPAPADNTVLKYNAGTTQWEAEAVDYSELTGVPTTFPPAPHNLDSHTDVSAPAPADNTVLKYNAGTTQWEAEAVDYSELTNVPTQFNPAPHNLDSHTDVNAPTPADNTVLKYNTGTGNWEPELVDYGELTNAPIGRPQRVHQSLLISPLSLGPLTLGTGNFEQIDVPQAALTSQLGSYWSWVGPRIRYGGTTPQDFVVFVSVSMGASNNTQIDRKLELIVDSDTPSAFNSGRAIVNYNKVRTDVGESISSGSFFISQMPLGGYLTFYWRENDPVNVGGVGSFNLYHLTVRIEQI